MGKSVFRFFRAIHLFIYQLSGGKIGGWLGIPILLLTTTGRKTGKKRTIPLGYFEHGGGYVVIGSNGGANTHPDWLHNLRSNPRATIQVKDNLFEARAEIAGPEDRARLWRRLMELAPFYTRYEKKTSREIPLVILYPAKV